MQFAVVLPVPLGVPSGPWGGGPDSIVPEELVIDVLQALMRIAKHYGKVLFILFNIKIESP